MKFSNLNARLRPIETHVRRSQNSASFLFSFFCAHLYALASSCVHHRMWNVFIFIHIPPDRAFGLKMTIDNKHTTFRLIYFRVFVVIFFIVPFAPQNFRLPSSVFHRVHVQKARFNHTNLMNHNANEYDFWTRPFRLIYRWSRFQWCSINIGFQRLDQFKNERNQKNKRNILFFCIYLWIFFEYTQCRESNIQFSMPNEFKFTEVRLNISTFSFTLWGSTILLMKMQWTQIASCFDSHSNFPSTC